jgi:hypothetical protein
MFKFNHLNVWLKVLFALLFNYFRSQVAFLAISCQNAGDIEVNVTTENR